VTGSIDGAGYLILPGDTHRLFNGFMMKIRDIFVKIFSDPRLILIAAIVAVIMYYVYVIYISQTITDIIDGMV